ncbi:hypothetical protein UFOVP1009_2 [uncultured Caudovirales phage]|uniref:Uncharacterized protein n=1 Tax=uncultured Caudovirales phage TaxID=2100421 RepID=A0A6J5Q354_9CAUD|nr:hypothetical protein UFOVP1009_2 [uncultured Caudovirales phage]
MKFTAVSIMRDGVECVVIPKVKTSHLDRIKYLKSPHFSGYANSNMFTNIIERALIKKFSGVHFGRDRSVPVECCDVIKRSSLFLTVEIDLSEGWK